MFTFSRLLKDILTEKNDRSYCPVRLCGMIGFIAYLCIATIELITHCKDFNLMECASGMTMILGIFAGGVTIKSKGEDR